MAPAFLRSLEKVILDGVREHAIANHDQGTMNLTSDPERVADERAHARREALLIILTGPLVTALLLAAWAAAGAGYFWPIWPMLGWGIGIGAHAASVYMNGEGIRDRLIEEELEKLRRGRP